MEKLLERLALKSGKRGGWRKKMGKTEFPTPNKRDPMAAMALRVGVSLH